MGLLPREKSKPANRFEDMITLVYGAPKVGKSTFCSQFDAPLFLDSEAGLRSLSTFSVGIGDWETLGAVYQELLADKKAGKLIYKTLVFDTIDNFYSMCLDYVCKRNNIKHPSDLDYDASGYTPYRQYHSP